ncbi:pirin family protein [Novosphingobium sp.]|uniref:pirin family protein n=1 Tax=Novosphingobium sp. TaxID=1874826 RepID=UPI003BA9803C
MATTIIAARSSGHAVPLGRELTVLRALPLNGIDAIGPFVFLDHGGPMAPPANGIGAHPHAGIEVITYLLQGSNKHRDSFGHVGEVSSGGVQWITSGRGMLHAEIPSGDGEPVMEAVQLWARHPEALDRTAPRYQAVQSHEIVEVETPGYFARLISGTLPGVFPSPGPVQLSQPSTLAHFTLVPGASVQIPLPPGQELGIFVMRGAGLVEEANAAKADILLLAATDSIALSARPDSAFEVLLLGGERARRPLVFAGSFVFNSQADVDRANSDLIEGYMGVLDGVPRGVTPREA